MDEETTKLVEACEQAWYWHCRSADMKAETTNENRRRALEQQLADDRLNHERARKALEEHLDRLSRQWMSDAGCTLPRIEDEGE